MKKIIATLVAGVSAFGLAFADDIKINFYNQVYSEDYFMAHHEWEDAAGDTHKKTGTDFPGIKERMYAEVFTDRVDAMVKATMTFDDDDDYKTNANGGVKHVEHYYIDGDIDDYYIEFRPIHEVTLGLHTGIFADGSYLPIYDDNVWAGNVGSNGFTATWRPSALNDALRIAVTTPFNTIAADDDRTKNWVTGNKKYTKGTGDDAETEEDDFDIGAGVIFTQEFFQIGFSVQDILDADERQFGAYVNFPGFFDIVPQLTIGGGVAHSERVRTAFDDLIGQGEHFYVSESEYEDLDEGGTRRVASCKHGLAYEDLVSSYLLMEFDHFNLSAEMLYNLKENYPLGTEGAYDFYGAVSFGFGLAGFNATATGKLLKDLTKHGAKAVHFGGFYLDYDINEHNTVGVGAEVDVCDKDWHAALPVYWKYHFEK